MRVGIIILLIVATGIIIYSNALGGDFIWDDGGFIIYNDFIKNPKALPMYFTSKDALAKGSLAGENYRPLFILSYAADYFFWKLNPLGYHITNVFFHVANAILLFFLILLIAKNKYTAAVASLIFLSHPIQTESVTWISGRADVLFLFFYMGALLLYVRFRQLGKVLFYFASLFLFLFSLLSKEMAASFPLMIILYDFFYVKKGNLGRKAVLYFPFFLTLELYVLVRLNIIGKLAQCVYWTGDAYTTFLSMSKGVIYYIRLLFYPVGLCADYLVFPLSRSLREPAVFLSIAAILFVLIAGCMLVKRQKNVSFSIFWFFITLLPVLNIIPMRILIAERFLYLPSIGYALLAGFLITALFERCKRSATLRKSVICFSALLIGAYSYLTVLRNNVWSDGVAFYSDIVKKYPGHSRAHLNLSAAYYNKGDFNRSIMEARKAIEAAGAGEYVKARKMLATSYFTEGRIEEAIAQYKRILEVDPQNVDAHMSLGFIYLYRNEYDGAHGEYRKALALNPDFLQAKVSMATLYLIKGEKDLAIKQYEDILKNPPPHHQRSIYAAAYLRLGDLYLSAGDRKKAKAAWRRVKDDFGDQLWFSEISRYLADELGLEELLKKSDLWQPEFKVLCYYYVGLKKEMSGDIKGARSYYLKAFETVAKRMPQIKLLAAKKLDSLPSR